MREGQIGQPEGEGVPKSEPLPRITGITGWPSNRNQRETDQLRPSS